MPEPLHLEARGLTVAFGSRTIVEDIALRIGAGDIAVIEGPSGGGKSTLLRAGTVWKRPCSS